MLLTLVNSILPAGPIGGCASQLGSSTGGCTGLLLRITEGRPLGRSAHPDGRPHRTPADAGGQVGGAKDCHKGVGAEGLGLGVSKGVVE